MQLTSSLSKRASTLMYSSVAMVSSLPIKPYGKMAELGTNWISGLFLNGYSDAMVLIQIAHFMLYKLNIRMAA